MSAALQARTCAGCYDSFANKLYAIFKIAFNFSFNFHVCVADFLVSHHVHGDAGFPGQRLPPSPPWTSRTPRRWQGRAQVLYPNYLLKLWHQKMLKDTERVMHDLAKLPAAVGGPTGHLYQQSIPEVVTNGRWSVAAKLLSRSSSWSGFPQLGANGQPKVSPQQKHLQQQQAKAADGIQPQVVVDQNQIALGHTSDTSMGDVYFYCKLLSDLFPEE